MTRDVAASSSRLSPGFAIILLAEFLVALTITPQHCQG
jgi:hypothetical protein